MNVAKRGIRFIVSGIVATGISYISFPLSFDYLFDKNFNLAFLFATAVNITISFLMQKYFVFKSEGYLLNEFIKFTFSASLLVFVSFVALKILVLHFKFDAFISNFVVVSISAITSYLIHSNVTFRGK